MSASRVTDYAERMYGLVPDQFRKPNIQSLLECLAVEIQAAEDMLWDLYTLRNIDASTDAALDLIGKVVGQSRGGLSDVVYRRYIRARISTNKSQGFIENLIVISRLIIDDVDARVVVESQGIATVVVRIEGGTPFATSGPNAIQFILLPFLREAVAAGVRPILEWGSSDLEDLFQFDDGPGLDVGYFAGADD